MNTEPQLPQLLGDVVAGFPSPAAQYTEEPLDLNALLVKRPAATFFVRASGNSMINAGIFDGDILVVDRSLIPADGAIVIACIDNEMTVKYLRLEHNGNAWLMPANPEFPPIFCRSAQEMRIFGVVTAAIHKYR